MAGSSNALKYYDDAQIALFARNGLEHFDFDDDYVEDATDQSDLIQAVRAGLEFGMSRHYHAMTGPSAGVRHFVRIQHSEGIGFSTINRQPRLFSGVVHGEATLSSAVRPLREALPPASHPDAPWQKLVMELGRLTDGWSGVGTVAPSASVLRDIQTVRAALPAGAQLPEVEIEPDDGTVILRWSTADMEETFTLTFAGKLHVTGFYSSQNGGPAWRVPVVDIKRLSTRFADEALQALLLG